MGGGGGERGKKGHQQRSAGTVLLVFWIITSGFLLVSANPDAKRLYDDLLSNYNKLVRPVVNVTDAVTVRLKLKLSQLIDVNLRNQIMTTNLWVEQFWYDYKMRWDPDEYGGVDMLHVPSDHIWRPDIVLYNNADGNFEVTLSTKATLFNTGLVEWRPPAIYHSSCEMDVEYFPFDEQTCVMKFGSWTYDGFQVDLRHQQEEPGSNIVVVGVDLTEFYMSVEWDILAVPAIRNVKFYTCCDEPYLDITFNITMRRKTLFYTVNLIIPCMGISFLTVLVFYLPSDSGEKVSLSISILLSLTVFFLLLAEIIPPTSLVVPLLGKFVLFTMILDTFSICVTVVVLNVHFRSPQTHTMAPWVRRVFIHILPRLLAMRRPVSQEGNQQQQHPSVKYHHHHAHQHHQQHQQQHQYYGGSKYSLPAAPPPPPPVASSSMGMAVAVSHEEELHNIRAGGAAAVYGGSAASPQQHQVFSKGGQQDYNNYASQSDDSEGCIIHGGPVNFASPIEFPSNSCPELYRALDGVRYIAECTKREEDSNKVKEDWKYVAMVLDRLFLWIFTVAVLVGSAGIILQAPALYDTRAAIDREFSNIEAVTRKPLSEQKKSLYLS